MFLSNGMASVRGNGVNRYPPCYRIESSARSLLLPDMRGVKSPPLLFFSHPLEIFTREQSSRFFDQMKVTLGITDKDQLAALLESYQGGDKKAPVFRGRSLLIAELMNFEQLAVGP